MELNKQQSLSVAELVAVASTDAWTVCFEALSHVPGATYVEGWAVNLETFTLFEHAWLVEQSRIIDPTRWQEDLTYFAGLHYSIAKAQEAANRQGYFPLAHRSPTEKCDQPLSSAFPMYWSAWEAANKLVDGQKRAYLWRSWRRWLDLLSERRFR